MKNRILVISHNPFSEISNNGKTLEAIFSKFNKEELSQLYFVDLALDPNFATSYFFVSDQGVVKSIFGKTIVNEHGKRTQVVEDISEQPVKVSKVMQLLRKNAMKLAIMRDALWHMVRPLDSQLFKNWIASFNPNFVFFVGSNQTFSHAMTRDIAKSLNVKFGVFFTDDEIIYPIKKGFLEKAQHKRSLRDHYKTVKESSVCFTIGDMMTEEYERFFKKPFYSIMNLVDTKNPIIQQTDNDKFVVSYFGGLHLDRWKKLVEFGKEIDPSKFIFQVFTPDTVSDTILDSFINANITYKGGVKDQELRDEIGKSDALIHVESDNPIYKSLTKLSVSTKIPEYLNTNKLVIAYGPDDIASIKLIKDNNVGLVITKKEQIKSTLDSILAEPSIIQSFSERGRSFVSAKFDIEKNSQEFKNIIEKVIHGD